MLPVRNGGGEIPKTKAKQDGEFPAFCIARTTVEGEDVLGAWLLGCLISSHEIAKASEI